MLNINPKTRVFVTRGKRQFLLCVFGLFIASTVLDVIRALEFDEYIHKDDDGDGDDIDMTALNECDKEKAFDDLVFEDADEMKSLHDWDFLIFSQEWPVTTCINWKKQNKNHYCNLRIRKEVWTIHGIWPTKKDTVGPSFCNNSATFDMNKLKFIVNELNLFWPNIETGTNYDSLWRHEWMKHGTCAADIEQMSDELKYFRQGLNWYTKGFSMSGILEKSGIYPNSNNTVISLHKAVVKVLGKNPSIHCLYDNQKDISYLAEIRICFDKTLQLIDCDGVRYDQVLLKYPGGTINTNCHASKPIYYPILFLFV